MSLTDDMRPTPIEKATESALRAIEERDRYPSGTAFLSAELGSFDAHFRRLASEGRPIVVLLPDGEELFLRPDVGLRRAAGRVWRAIASTVTARRAKYESPLIGGGASDGRFEISLRRLKLAGYEAQLHGLRR